MAWCLDTGANLHLL